MRSQKPTHTSITNFLTTLLPPKESDLPRLYHVPRHPRYNPSLSHVDRIVLSITPTPGVYERIEYVPPHKHQANALPTGNEKGMGTRPPRTVAFLHRPFNLDRRRVRRGNLILASHTAFDEVLTVGYNTVLAGRLGLDVGSSVCIQGYKGDDERRIGIVGRVQGVRRGEMVQRVRGEFGVDVELEKLKTEKEGGNRSPETESKIEEELEGERDVQVVAIMNAFNPETVQRVMDAATKQGWLGTPSDNQIPGSSSKVLYLTGQPRQSGMEAASALDMAVVCVGHREAEEWGIRYLAQRLRAEFPGVSVEEVFEDEEEVPKAVSSERMVEGRRGGQRQRGENHGFSVQSKAGD